MGAPTLRSLCHLLLFFVGKHGLSQASAENIPFVDLPYSPGTQPSNYSPAPQLMNTLLTVANANGVLPELLSATKPMWVQRENAVPLQNIAVCPPHEETHQQSNPVITTDIPPMSVRQPSFVIRPNVFPIVSSNFKFPSVQVTPTTSVPIPHTTIPISQTFSPEIHNEDDGPYTFLKYEDFFDNSYQFDDRLENNIRYSNDVDVHEVNVHSTALSTIPEILDISNTLISVQSDIRELANGNAANKAQMPYKIEINLPVLASSLPNVSPPQVPFSQYGGYPIPPIIIQDSSKSSLKKLLPLILISMLQNDGNDGGGCGNCKTIPVPYPIPISTYNPVIVGPPRRSRKTQSNSAKDNTEDLTEIEEIC